MRNKKVFTTTVTLCVIIVGLGYYLYQQDLDFEMLAEDYASLKQEYAALEQRNTLLESEYNSLTSEYSFLKSEHNRVVSEYSSLSQKYDSLKSENDGLVLEYNSLSRSYDSLKSQHNTLQTDHQNLNFSYTKLDEDYKGLFSDYKLLTGVFDKPLAHKEVPTIEALERWLLYEDQTDKLEYEYPDFACGDFAVMLAMHARVKHWDMGVIGIRGYDAHCIKCFKFLGYCAHAFNVIRTTEGPVYIEPQTDKVWWYGDEHEEICTGTIYEIEDQEICVQDITIILKY